MKTLESELRDSTEATMAEFQVWNQKNEKKKSFKFKPMLKPPWPSYY
jgi:hypothetical protein